MAGSDQERRYQAGDVWVREHRGPLDGEGEVSEVRVGVRTAPYYSFSLTRKQAVALWPAILFYALTGRLPDQPALELHLSVEGLQEEVNP